MSSWPPAISAKCFSNGRAANSATTIAYSQSAPGGLTRIAASRLPCPAFAATLSITCCAAHLAGSQLISFAAEHTSLTFTVNAVVIIVAVALLVMVLVSVWKACETEAT